MVREINQVVECGFTHLVVERGFTHLVVERGVTVEGGGVWDGESDSPGSRTWCNC